MNAASFQSFRRRVSIDSFIEADNIYKPRHARREQLDDGRFNARDFTQSFAIPIRRPDRVSLTIHRTRHLGCSEPRQTFHQGDSCNQDRYVAAMYRRARVPDCEARTIMFRGIVLGCNHNSAFTGCDLLVRVKREDCVIAERSGGLAFIFPRRALRIKSSIIFRWY